jgi:ATP-dependent Clp protease adaptor protein ClpS
MVSSYWSVSRALVGRGAGALPGVREVTRAAYGGAVPIAPVEQESVSTDEVAEVDVPWITLVWNDPVNLMSYVTFVFQSYFGYPKAKAERLMMDVHVKGRAVVSTGSREKMETDTEALQGYGLWATFQKDS